MASNTMAGCSVDQIPGVMRVIPNMLVLSPVSACTAAKCASGALLAYLLVAVSPVSVVLLAVHQPAQTMSVQMLHRSHVANTQW